MTYRYRGWTLYSRDVNVGQGVIVTIYFFARRQPKFGRPVKGLPRGRAVVWDEKSSQPVLDLGYKGYPITAGEYYRMRKRQGGICAICRKKPAKGTLVIDHSHNDGKVRGLLCTKCNAGLGLFGDDSDRLVSAARYLKVRRP